MYFPDVGTLNDVASKAKQREIGKQERSKRVNELFK